MRSTRSDAVDRGIVWRTVAAAVAAVQGVVLIGNGAAVAVIVARDGLTGPAPIASPAGVVVEVLLYVLFGAGLLWISWGLGRGSSAAVTPFVLAQVLGLTVSVPLAGGTGLPRLLGLLATLICLVGLASWVGMLRHREGVEPVQ